MRIIGGKFKGRKFIPPAKNWPTRPTTDFAKEALFNILNNRLSFEDSKVLDLFGGTGSHSYEFISRGCRDVTYVDRHRACIRFVEKTAQTLSIENYIQIRRADVFRFLKNHRRRYDYIFADPPFDMADIDRIPKLILENKLLKKEGMLVIEHDDKKSFERHPHFVESRGYGKIIFSFFQTAE